MITELAGPTGGRGRPEGAGMPVAVTGAGKVTQEDALRCRGAASLVTFRVACVSNRVRVARVRAAAGRGGRYPR